jgi:hypothetical protein
MMNRQRPGAPLEDSRPPVTVCMPERHSEAHRVPLSAGHESTTGLLGPEHVHLQLLHSCI